MPFIKILKKYDHPKPLDTKVMGFPLGAILTGFFLVILILLLAVESRQTHKKKIQTNTHADTTGRIQGGTHQ